MGIIGIPIGNPKFVTNAIALESVFIVLTILSLWRLKNALIPNMIIAIVVIIGGYLLQCLLLITSMIVFKNREHLRLKTK